MNYENYITARNSMHLQAQIDRFNASRDADNQIIVNYGPERGGNKKTWFIHREWGNKPQNNLSFNDVCEYVQKMIDEQVDHEQYRQRMAGEW